MHILLVEDDPDIRMMTEAVITLEGHTVVAVATGREALHAVEGRGPFDAALVDLGLPDMPGTEVASTLCEQGCTIPLIALTGMAARDVGPDCREAGFARVLTKPVSIEALLEALSEP